MRMSSASSAGRSSPPKARCSRLSSSSTQPLDAVDLLARAQSVGAARVDPGLHLVEEPGHPHHVELVQIGGVDRAEAQTLEQRHLGILGQLQDPSVELQPGHLPVEVQTGIVEVGYYRLGQGDIVLSHRLPPGPLGDLAKRPRRRARCRSGGNGGDGDGGAVEREPVSGRELAQRALPGAGAGGAHGRPSRASSAAPARRPAAAASRRRGRRRDGRGARCGGSRPAPPGRPRRSRSPAARSPRPRGSPGRRCR